MFHKHLDFGIFAFYVDDIILTTHSLTFLVYLTKFLKDGYELIDLQWGMFNTMLVMKS